MSTAWQTITVRVSCPSEGSLDEFLAIMRTWLNHHCILLADLRDNGDGFDALFDNPRDARLFERRFAARPTSSAPSRIALYLPVTVTAPAKEMPVLDGLIPVPNAT